MKNGRKDNWPIAYRWAAMGTLIAYSAVGTEKFNLARAQDIAKPTGSNNPVSETQGSQPVWRFDIPAGSVESTLDAFEKVTGVKVTVAKNCSGNTRSATARKASMITRIWSRSPSCTRRQILGR